MKKYFYDKYNSIFWRDSHDSETVTIGRPFAAGSEGHRKIIDLGVYIAPYVEPAKTLVDIRQERDLLLSANVDIYNPIRWAELSAAQKDKVKKYRQALLDITKQDPTNAEWPEVPVI